MQVHRWVARPSQYTLAPQSIHIWQVSLDPSQHRLEHLQEILAEDEQARAQRFRFDVDRERFIIARGCLRQVLSGYVGVAPQALCFSYGSHGKPVLANPRAAQSLHFNVSHSHQVALYAIASNWPVGIDVEHIHTVEWRELAKHVFSAKEQLALQHITAPLQQEAFFKGWTRKEAFVKALGQGLSIPLDQFDVTLHPQEPAAILNITWNPEETAQWQLIDVSPSADYCGALAVCGQPQHLCFWKF
ncbi:MAG TPA: 4'-phosphopantetheinyl transferase superfamily protein [Stenomitos sp.]